MCPEGLVFHVFSGLVGPGTLQVYAIYADMHGSLWQVLASQGREEGNGDDDMLHPCTQITSLLFS